MQATTIIFIVLGAFIAYFVLRQYAEGFEHWGKAPLEVARPSYSPPKTVQAGGPNPPSQEPPKGEAVMYGEPAPSDPMEGDNQAAGASDSLRYPERAFKRAVQPGNTQIAVESGIAGADALPSPQAYQGFGPDFVQNGGQGFDGTYANDAFSNPNFSAF